MEENLLLLKQKSEEVKVWIKREEILHIELHEITNSNKHGKYLNEFFSAPPDEEIDLKKGLSMNTVNQVISLKRKSFSQEKQLTLLRNNVNSLKELHEEYLQSQTAITKDLNKVEDQISYIQDQLIDSQNRLLIPSVLMINDESGCNKVKENDSEYILFSRDKYVQLQDRIPELMDEIEKEKSSYQNLEKQKRRYEDIIKGKQSELDEQNLKCQTLEEMKFGKCIDLEALDAKMEKNGHGQSEVDFEADINCLSKLHQEEIKQIRDEINILEKQELDYLSENTHLCEKIAKLKARKIFLKEQLQKESKQVKKQTNTQSLNDYKEEIKQLKEKERAQICCKEKIEKALQLLKLKHGHIPSDLLNDISF